MSVNQQSHKEPAQAPPAAHQEPKKQEQKKETPAPAAKQATGVKNSTAPAVSNSTKVSANSTKAPKPAEKAVEKPAAKKVVVEKEDPETEGMSSEEKEVYNMNKKLKAKKQEALEKAEEGSMGSSQRNKAQSKSKKMEEEN